jgi:hypothetical protein
MAMLPLTPLSPEIVDQLPQADPPSDFFHCTEPLPVTRARTEWLNWLKSEAAAVAPVVPVHGVPYGW